MLTGDDFAPTGLLAHTHVQSWMASNKMRRRAVLKRQPGMAASSRRLTLDCGDGVRLYGYYSPHPASPSRENKGLVVLIHGWEGCRDSVYLVSMATTLWYAGYDVLRLDQRDHGGSQHLNRDPFHSVRLSDPLGALADIAKRLPGGDNPALIGWSLGGNFALRLAVEAPKAGLSLRRVLAVSPSINPLATIRGIDSGPAFYRWYFHKKWHRGLSAKQAAWPDDFDFTHFRALKTFEAATEHFAPLYTPFDDYLSYVQGYSVTTERMADLTVPATILTARDDTVVPIEDFDGFSIPGNDILISDAGGHCGFVESWGYRCFTERLALERLAL